MGHALRTPRCSRQHPGECSIGVRPEDHPLLRVVQGKAVVEQLGALLAPVAAPVGAGTDGPVAVEAGKDVEGVGGGHVVPSCAVDRCGSRLGPAAKLIAGGLATVVAQASHCGTPDDLARCPSDRRSGGSRLRPRGSGEAPDERPDLPRSDRSVFRRVRDSFEPRSSADERMCLRSASRSARAASAWPLSRPWGTAHRASRPWRSGVGRGCRRWRPSWPAGAGRPGWAIRARRCR
jgi:hypothetical protein